MSQPQATTPNASNKKRKKTQLIDIPADRNLAPGTRLQVKWTISDDGKDDASDADATESAAASPTTNEASASPPSNNTSVWWTATLKQLQPPQIHTLTPEQSDEIDLNSQTTTLPIYELDYDPLPAMGFDERAIETVAFVSNKTLLNLSSEEFMIYRLEGENSPPPSPTFGEDEVEDQYVNADGMSTLLDEIMERSLNTVAKGKMDSLPMNVQMEICEKMKGAKEELYKRLMEKVEGEGERVVTGDMVRSVIREMK